MGDFRVRRSFGRYSKQVAESNLIEIQKSSYNNFLQKEVAPEFRKNDGLQEIFKEAFSVDPTAKNVVEFLSYSLDDPVYNQDDCIKKDLSYSSGLKVKLRVIRYDSKGPKRVVKEIKEQDVYLADVPLMTNNAMFIINGTYRVIISQLHKSAGVFFNVETLKNQGMRKIYSAHIVPFRGSWLDFEIDSKGLGWVRIDKKRKILLSTFLMFSNLEKDEPEERTVFSKEDILKKFYDLIVFNRVSDSMWRFDFSKPVLEGFSPNHDILNASGEVIVKSGTKISKTKLAELEKIGSLFVRNEALLGYCVAADYIVDDEVKIAIGCEIDENNYKRLESSVTVLSIDNIRNSSCIRDTVINDKNNTLEDALRAFSKIIRPGEVVSSEGVINIFRDMFFNFDRFDLSIVGRMKMNYRLRNYYEKPISDARVLSSDDFFSLIRGLVAVRAEKEKTDDIDHLGFRRVRSVGELVANQCRGAMFKIVKAMKERLNMVEPDDDVNLHDLVNSRTLTSALREFFCTSQLSQIVDNINALAEVSHKRRVTAMGPGGLDSLRATFEVRDIHSTHYGRICVVETPEGQNIGLINYLAIHAVVDEYGFVKTPYRKVSNGIIQDEIVYLNAQEEEVFKIASFCVTFDEDNRILDKIVSCRLNGEYVLLPSQEVDYIDVSSGQILSVAASLIPFIENDDPNRALMGSNMQRQALPLKNPEAPVIGTGMERQIGVDSMTVLIAEHDGKVIQLDSGKILIKRSGDTDKIDVYNLKKYQRSNAYSCINQTPTVNVGQNVKKGDLLADGSTTDNGEIALGKNLRVAFIAYKGLTFEDSILISERLKNDVLTSVRVEEFNIAIKEGEEVTRSIPGVSDEFLKTLDETGLVYVGAKVEPGYVLVGRVAPKAESPVSPEERLLKAMFGNKADNVVDASLRLPPGCQGTVTDVQLVSRKGLEKDERSLLIERLEIQKLLHNCNAEIANLHSNYHHTIENILVDEEVAIAGQFSVGFKLDREAVAELSVEELFNIAITNSSKMDELNEIKENINKSREAITKKFDIRIKNIQDGDNLPPGVIKHIKVFVATNRVIEAGDKLAGRHGNKGVVAKVLPVSDMPYDDNGEPVDIVLNTLSLASRMNIGQIFETHLGLVAHEIGKQVKKMLGGLYNGNASEEDLRALLKKIYPKDVELDDMNVDKMINIAMQIKDGMKFAVPSFDGAKMEDIKNLLIEWGLPENGQIMLRDGATGEYFNQPITVGYMYINKLNHMVADKIHARSTGSYSLVTQQPPGGRARMGGQRQGEMETWALEAYGAAYITRESMTIKSDDHAGRIAAYEAITQGYDVTNDNYYTPEAFKILQSEMRCIGINIESVNKVKNEAGDNEWMPAVSSSKFEALRISLLSPDQIRRLSFGEVKKSETINYRTQKAELEGLHCPAIFGPEKDYKCACGRYNKMKYRGMICEKCNVEITLARVRRERMGHIELATPVAHIWFAKILPSKIGKMLGLASKELDKVLRYEKHLVVKPGITKLEKGQLLSEEELMKAQSEYGQDAFVAMIGAEALEESLKNIDLEEERDNIMKQLKNNPIEANRRKLIKKLQLVKCFINTKTRPEWMILRALPVMPADLRPLVPLDGGRFATSDVNELYRKILNRNNRLKELQLYDFPEIVLRNEKRMLQNSVDALIDNSRLDKPFVTSNGRPLQSIGDTLKGKQGRFRQNLLGKRVDYSGRSVIVVGSTLKLHQCGLPKKMALELFRPFVYARLEQYGYAPTIRSAKRIVDEQRPEVWEILKEVTYQHPVLLNRAPTLHRLGIQAFEIVLVDHNAIELHPLVCAAYNADFDGDQMSVHIPLSVEAQIEARVLMMPTNNMISPANGKAVVTPKKDMVLGLYYLTDMRESAKGSGMSMNVHEVYKALEEGVVDLQAPIECYIDCIVEGVKKFNTTPGRVIFYDILPKNHGVAFERINKLIVSKDTVQIFSMVYENASHIDSVQFADDLMRLGFKYAALSGATCTYYDIVIPKNKTEIVENTWNKINEYRRLYNEGLITEDERRNNVTDAWYKCDEILGKATEAALSERSLNKTNSLYMMYNSGARGSITQMRQMMSMRGFVAKTGGQILENAVSKSYAEGLDPHSYYLATHGTRKGLSDIALKTADAGYFTRKLVDVAQDCIITSSDCCKQDNYDNFGKVAGFDTNYIICKARTNGDDFDYSLANGRFLAEDVYSPIDNSLLIEKDVLLRREEIGLLEKMQVLSIKIRSPITCSNEFGICSKCYGVDLSKGKEVSIGEAVGIIAAQSIGEPGAQLTMHTFHTGGGARYMTSEAKITATCNGEVAFRNIKIATKADGAKVVIGKYTEISVIDSLGRERYASRVPYGSTLFVESGQKVKQGQILCEWDKNTIPKLAPVDGYIAYSDLIEGVSLRKVIDESTGLVSRIVSDWKQGGKKINLSPMIVFKDDQGKNIVSQDGSLVAYSLEPEDVVLFEEGTKIRVGDLIVKKQKKASVSGDITSGLPRLIEIFEARAPKIQATLCEHDGVVVSTRDYRSKKCVTIAKDANGEHVEYNISKDLNLLVQVGDPIRKGDLLCDGDVSAHDIMRVQGIQDLVQHLLFGIQSIFNQQGMAVDNKHVECILRCMLRKVEVVEAGDSEYIVGEQLEYCDFVKTLSEISGVKPKATPILLGIARAASMDASFIKAASFQESHKVFVQASLNGQIDELHGMKQRLITGHLIPAGTGFVPYDWMQKYSALHKIPALNPTLNPALIPELDSALHPELSRELNPELSPILKSELDIDLG